MLTSLLAYDTETISKIGSSRKDCETALSIVPSTEWTECRICFPSPDTMMAPELAEVTQFQDCCTVDRAPSLLMSLTMYRQQHQLMGQ